MINLSGSEPCEGRNLRAAIPHIDAHTIVLSGAKFTFVSALIGDATLWSQHGMKEPTQQPTTRLCTSAVGYQEVRTTETSTCRPRRAATRLSLESRPLQDLRICTRGDSERSSLIYDMQRQSRPQFPLAQKCARGTVLPLDAFPDSAAVLLRHELGVVLEFAAFYAAGLNMLAISVLQIAIWRRMASGMMNVHNAHHKHFCTITQFAIPLLHSLVLTSTHIQHSIKVANHTDISFASAIVVNSTQHQ